VVVAVVAALLDQENLLDIQDLHHYIESNKTYMVLELANISNY
jgi:hypothetical protein